LPRNRPTTARARSRAIIRTAFSLLGLAAAAGGAAAQSDPRPTYTPPAYNVKISPWPAAPAAAPAAPAWAQPPLPGTPLPAPPRTVYYKKEPNTWVVPAGAHNLPPPPKALPPASPPLPPAGFREVDQFRLESETELNRRINVEKGLTPQQLEEDQWRLEYNRTVTDRKLHKELVGTYFPEQDPIAKDPYHARLYVQRAMLVEPHYVCYGRLFFEEKNTERYGWELGPLTPIWLTGKFFVDVGAWPYKVFSFPRLRYD